MTRADRQMPDVEARAFLRAHALAHVGTNDADGWPYVVPLMYVYEDGDRLYLHTGTRGGHFRTNVGNGVRICLSVSEQGPMHTGTPSACNSSLTYESAIVFGNVRVCGGNDLEERKAWFFDRLLERLGDSPSNYQSGYNMLKQIELYEVEIEILTGKINSGLHH
jgi:hypothetical protein